MSAIEASNASLKGVLPKDYARPALNKQMLGELIDLIGGIGLGEPEARSKDTLGRVYEYFLGKFANAEGRPRGYAGKRLQNLPAMLRRQPFCGGALVYGAACRNWMAWLTHC